MRNILAGAAIAYAVFNVPAVAGEVGEKVGRGCDLKLAQGCLWDPRGCFPPAPPAFVVSDRESYRAALRQFTDYTQRMQAYVDCAAADGEKDTSDRFPTIVKKALEEIGRTANSDIDTVRADLERQRTMLRVR